MISFEATYKFSRRSLTALRYCLSEINHDLEHNYIRKMSLLEKKVGDGAKIKVTSLMAKVFESVESVALTKSEIEFLHELVKLTVAKDRAYYATPYKDILTSINKAESALKSHKSES